MKKEPETTPPTSTKRRRSDLAARARDDDTSSNTGEDELDEDVKPEIKPEPKKRQRRQPSKSDEPKSGQWTPTKRAILMEKVISAGYKSLDLDQVANELGLNKRQLINQLTSGRSGNFRDKCIKFISGGE